MNIIGLILMVLAIVVALAGAPAKIEAKVPALHVAFSLFVAGFIFWAENWGSHTW